MDEQTREYGQSNLTLPHDVVPLPSGGIFYKNKKKSVKVGYLTASDENILIAGGENLTMNLLRAKIYEPDIRPEEMLEGDIEAILIFLRNTSFGPEMNLTLQDPADRKTFNAVVTLDELQIIKGKDPNPDGTFNLTLPKTQAEIRVKPLTYGETLEINNMVKTYPQGRVPPKVTQTLQRQILEINGSSDRGEIAQFVEKMPIMDSKFIKAFMRENEPRLNTIKTVKAPSGELLAVDVSLGDEFFRPFF